jgi:hypothetical protein
MLLLIKNGTVINPGDQTQAEADAQVKALEAAAKSKGFSSEKGK